MFVDTPGRKHVKECRERQAWARYFDRLPEMDRLDVLGLGYRRDDPHCPYLRYQSMVASGESHKMALMLASRSFPGIKTDSIFNEGKFSGDADRVTPHQVWLQDEAARAGVSTNGMWYCSGLADYPGDPTAWVGSRGDVLRIAEQKNMRVRGYVEYQNREVEPPAPVPVAEDIVQREVAEILAADPTADPGDVRDRVIEVRSGAVNLDTRQHYDDLPPPDQLFGFDD